MNQAGSLMKKYRVGDTVTNVDLRLNTDKTSCHSRLIQVNSLQTICMDGKYLSLTARRNKYQRIWHTYSVYGQPLFTLITADIRFGMNSTRCHKRS